MLRFLILLTIGHISGGSLMAQCNYDKNSYPFESEKNILFGVLPDYRNLNDSLFLDIYWPVGSVEKEKPLIIWAFGGGFFQGKRQDFAAICQEMAQRGIVSATIDYRLGFDGPGFGLNPPFAYDAAEILRAGYRGATDMKGAIRFLKQQHQKYEIDLSRIWIGGASAGAIVAMNAAFLNKDSEKPKEAGVTTSIGVKERLDLGPVEGILNQNGYNSEVQGVFNIFGALLDTSAVDAKDRIAVFSYHQTGDPIVPCLADKPYYPIPLISQNYPIAYGSCVITDRFKNLSIPDPYWETWIYTGTEHAVHNQDEVLNFMIEQAKPFFCKTITHSLQAEDSGIQILPNPAESYLQVKNLNKPYSYKIFNTSGQIMMSGHLIEHPYIEIEPLPSGIYLLKLTSNSDQVTIKWLKQ